MSLHIIGKILVMMFLGKKRRKKKKVNNAATGFEDKAYFVAQSSQKVLYTCTLVLSVFPKVLYENLVKALVPIGTHNFKGTGFKSNQPGFPRFTFHDFKPVGSILQES